MTLSDGRTQDVGANITGPIAPVSCQPLGPCAYGLPKSVLVPAIHAFPPASAPPIVDGRARPDHDIMGTTAPHVLLSQRLWNTGCGSLIYRSTGRDQRSGQIG